MVFSSVIFIFAFLPVFLILYFLTPSKFKNTIAVVGSLFFYAWGAPKFIFILLLMTWLDYKISKLIYQYHDNTRKKISWLRVSIIVNLVLLFYFKYSNFFVEEFNFLLDHFGLDAVKWRTVILPIGISFVIFQKMSYVIDVYYGKVKPAQNYQTLVLYIFLFPQLIAGPIICYNDICEQISNRKHTLNQYSLGIIRFVIGLAKKILIADSLGQVADKVFESPENFSSLGVWVGVLCYTLQIYFDFSGYSDMAIGLGRFMGFRFIENFNYPYISKSFTEFWRRWHISLSTWMRQYLYIPLGGNKVSSGRNYFNLWIVFVLSGLWHGASWNFILWGAYNGFFLSYEKLCRKKWNRRHFYFYSVPLTFLFTMCGWVIFRANNLDDMYVIFTKMFGITKLDYITSIGSIINNRSICTLILATLISFYPLTSFQFDIVKLPRLLNEFGYILFIIFLFVWSIMTLVSSGFHPFIYFRF